MTWERQSIDGAEFIEDDQAVASVTFDEELEQWVAESEGQSLACLSYEEAVSFVEAVRTPRSQVARVRTRSNGWCCPRNQRLALHLEV